MENYIIIRLGIPVPTQEEFKLVHSISEGEPIGGPIFPEQPGLSGTVTLIKSRLSSQEIAIRFQELSIGLHNPENKDGNVAPVMVFKADSNNFAYNIDMSNFLDWGESFQKHFNVEVSQKQSPAKAHTLDDLLDLMNERGGGFDKLDLQEQELFQQLSSNM
tara:strand:+ start:77 stop:559 length:483 start_codon:yes stop_codon:yes gene_type:complete